MILPIYCLLFVGDWRYIQRSGCSTYQMNTNPADRLSLTFAALADPTRRAILTRLADGAATVNELAEPFPISVQAVSKHLGVLERAGLITRGRSAQLRPSRLRAQPLKDVADWLGSYQRFWDAGFDLLDERLRNPENETRDG
jgi:DNA-binding transcriptional ArsR family regulator